MSSQGGCFSFLKFLVFTVNFVLWLVGLGVLGVSLWLLFDRDDYFNICNSSHFNTIQTVDNIYAVNIYAGILKCRPAQLAVPADHGGPEDGLLPGHLHPAGGGHTQPYSQ